MGRIAVNHLLDDLLEPRCNPTLDDLRDRRFGPLAGDLVLESGAGLDDADRKHACGPTKQQNDEADDCQSHHGKPYAAVEYSR